MIRRFSCMLTITLTIILSIAWPVQANISIKIDDSNQSPVTTTSSDERASIIIEVDGDPDEHREYLELHHPFIDVIATYDKLFNGLAIQGKPDKIAKISSLEFIRAIHPVQTYEALSHSFSRQFQNIEQVNTVIPSEVNTTAYTGKGIKVAVIDTGIDYQHPDLTGNYKGGYDLVDLDDDPMETLEAEGVPTSHGSHVAGIIAANGNLKGVAPGADIYAYRALGPGGQGTSVQVIAAMEQAVRDGVDIMNLSLGNSINGPDYPTSVAVNRATDLGIAVVIANGNSGPNNWTVGSPATATKAISVGASSAPEKIPYLYESLADKSIDLAMMVGSEAWDVPKGNVIENMDQNPKTLQGKIALSQRSDVTFYDKAKQAEEDGAVALLIYNNEEGPFQGAIANDQDLISIPVASISLEDGEWLKEQLEQHSPYLETKYLETLPNIAPFSSRGPVTVNWEIKPDVLAPGTNILSTVPGGYEKLQGTSMAAPHVAGAIALMKEAKPHWTNEQIVGALKTTALQMKAEDGEMFEPIVQGAGHIQVEQAINSDTIIYNTNLSFGKMDGYHDEKEVSITIENVSNETQQFYFDMPKKQSDTKSFKWHLPQSFKLEGGSKKTITIGLNTNPSLIEEGLQQGWLSLHSEKEIYHLPYLFVNQTADYPRTMGFGLSLKPFMDDTYVYQLYLTEEAEKVDVHLYDLDSLMYEKKLFELTEPKVGLNEGEVNESVLPKPGIYKAVITMELENGNYMSHETELMIAPN